MDVYRNLAISTVAIAPSPASSGTSLQVAPGDGSKFGPAPFTVIVYPAGSLPSSVNAEFPRVTVVATDTFTITRAYESGGITRSIQVGDVIARPFTAALPTDIARSVSLGQVFRQMNLRSHPDADKSVDQVLMTSCAELVTDLGTRCNPRAGLSLSMASSGLGGLDTGSRTASKWYSIWYVIKGPTATTPDVATAPTSDGIVAHLEKDYLADQTQNTNNTTENLRAGATDRVKLGQSFQTSVTGPVELVNVVLIKVGTPTGRVWLTIEADTAGAPSGTPLATSIKLDASLVSTTAQTIAIPFPNNTASLTATTTYWLVFQGDYTASGANYVGVRYQNTSVYANGKLRKFDGTVWADDGTSDAAFVIYVTENSSALTLPSGYTDKCLLGYAYNDSGNKLIAFKAKDRRVALNGINVGASVNAGTATIPTLVDCSTLLPPLPVIAQLFCQISVSTDTMVVMGMPDGYMGAFLQNPERFAPGGVTGDMDFILTEYQRLWYYRASGTGNLNVFVTGFEW